MKNFGRSDASSAQATYVKSSNCNKSMLLGLCLLLAYIHAFLGIVRVLIPVLLGNSASGMTTLHNDPILFEGRKAVPWIISGSNFSKYGSLLEEEPGNSLPERIAATTNSSDKFSNSSVTSEAPIYLSDFSSVEPRFASISIDSLLTLWDRNTTYYQMFQFANLVPSLPQPTRQHSTAGGLNRTVAIVHCIPKMASTVLRKACVTSLKETCNLDSTRLRPVGISETEVVEDLILNRCNMTHHFCVQGDASRIIFPRAIDAGNLTLPASKQTTAQKLKTLRSPQAFSGIKFIHLVPFRNFDDWLASALKQVHYHAANACTRLGKKLGKCRGFMELDFEKYTQPMLRLLQRIIDQRSRNLKETHVILLYDVSHMNETLMNVNSLYQLPKLQHLNGRGKQRRTDGKCPPSILQKLHECFDHRFHVSRDLD